MNIKTTIILLLVLVALGAALYFTKGDARTTHRATEKMIPQYEADKIKKIRIENAERNEKVVLARVQGGDDWELLEPLRYPADRAQAQFLARFFSDYEGRRIGKTGDADVQPSQQGLDKPRAVLEFEGIGEKPIRIRIGVDSPLNKSDCFIQVDEVVYLAARTIYNSIAKPSSRFRDDHAFSHVASAADMDQIEVSQGGSATILKKVEGEWTLVAPVRGLADAKRAGQIANALAVLRVQGFENDNPADLGIYQLTAPALSVTVRRGEKSQTVKFGKTDGSATYAMREGLGSVWKVQEQDVSALRFEADALREASVFGSFEQDKVERVAWKSATAEVEFSFDSIARKAKLQKPREAEAGREAFDGAIRTMQGMRADAVTNIASLNLAELGLSPALGYVELKLKGAAKPVRVELGAVKPDGMYLRRASDDYVLRIPVTSAQFLSRPAVEYVSRDIVNVDSYAAGYVELDATHGSDRKSAIYVKDDNNKWTLKGNSEEVPAFGALADDLWHSKATDVLPGEIQGTPVENPQIEVRVFRKSAADAKPDERDRDRIGTLRFSEDGSGAWYCTGISGSATTGGFLMRCAPELPMKVIAFLFGPAATQPASKPADANK
jgi:hypothetical protein